MESSTWYFEDVFPDETSFTDFLTDYGVTLPTSITASSLYKLFMDKYLNCSIAFDTKEVFKRRFSLLLNDYLTEFSVRVGVKTALYDLSEDDLLVVNTYINNYANNPNYEVTDVFSELGYVSNQNNGINRINKLTAYINFLKGLLPYGSQEFLERFKKLFKYIYIRRINIYGNN